MVVPVYNVEKYLKRCLDSIINQTYKNIEIILVNDGSKDNSRDICEEYEKNYENVSLINQENGGLSAARNTGLKYVKGEAVTFVDSDDWLELDAIEYYVDSMKKYNVDMVVTNNIRTKNYQEKIIKEGIAINLRILSYLLSSIQNVDNNEELILFIKERLEYLINVRRPKNIKDLQEARALGDLSENAEYHAAREEQSLLETEIKTIELQLSNAEIIKKKDNGKVGLGSKVTIEYLDDDETDEYMIVGSREADPANSKISNESPIGQALIGKKVGEIADVESPNGKYQIRVKEIN